MHSDQTMGSLFRSDCWRRPCVRRRYFSWSCRVPGPMGRSLVSSLDCVGGEWDPRRRDPGALCHHGNYVGCRTAHAAMVVAACLVYCWARRDGGVGASTAEFVSLPCDLDVATLDTGYRSGVTNAVGGISSHDGNRSPISVQIECPAVGGGAFAHVIVARVSSNF